MRKMKKKAETGDTTAGLVDQLNLEEFAGVLDNAPPGTDELVALSKVRQHRAIGRAGGGMLRFYKKKHLTQRKKSLLDRIHGAPLETGSVQYREVTLAGRST